MHFLALSILSSSLIILSFKVIDRYSIRTFHAIAVNYWAATLLGLALIGFRKTPLPDIDAGWLPMALVIGVLFVVMFYVIGLTAKKSGITVTAVAGRISVIIPILFSILFYREPVSLLKMTGIGLALPALVMTTLKKKLAGVPAQVIYLPFLLFLGSGLVDSLVKYSQQEYLTGAGPFLFATSVFATSLLSSAVPILVRLKANRAIFSPRTLLAGALLGIFNFSSLFFFIQALNHAPFDSSIIFGLNHLGIILTSLLAGVLFFREALNRTNLAGIGLACLAIILLYYA